MTNSIEPLNPIVRPRRIGLCGGTTVEPENAVFAESLGRELVTEEGLILVTGGLKCFIKDPDKPSADWSFVHGAIENLENIPIERKIETLLPDPSNEPLRAVRFKEGTVITLKGRSLQSRRFKLVGSVDILVAIEGSKGTREIIDLAFALEKPVLPLPFTGGIAQQRWNENKKLIYEWFEIDKSTAKMWEELSLKDMAGSEIVSLAKSVKQYLLHQLRRKCFIMMPFGEEFLPLYHIAIKTAVEEAGFLPVRTDHLDLVGDVVGALHSAIRMSTCGLAVITGNNANVMYELGLAHAQAKPVILLCEKKTNSGDLPEVPYDLKHESIIGYTKNNLNGLKQSIYNVLCQLKGH